MRWSVSAVLIACFIHAGTALGQGSDGVDFERFKPAMDSQGVFVTEGGQGEEAGDITIGIYTHFSYEPLEIIANLNLPHTLVSHRVAGNLYASIGIAGWLALSVDVPGVVYQQGDILDSTSGASLMELDQQAWGDVRVAPKITMLRQKSHGISMAITVPVSIPSGNQYAFSGARDNNFTVSPTLAISGIALSGRLLLALNVGGWIRGPWTREAIDSYLSLNTYHELFARGGIGARLAEGWWLLGEVTAASKYDDPFRYITLTPVEGYLGLRFRGPGDVWFTFGGAVGIVRGWGIPVARGFFGFTWAPRLHDQDEDGIVDDQDRCPKRAGPAKNDGCPWGDADGDGIKDNLDKCRGEVGPKENDGCPWGDVDGDGIKDNDDKCKEKPGPTENGGCPWEDSDGDGIRDNQDKCPKKAGPAENDGCPYQDSDGDGVKDMDDKCMAEPGPVENNGCPWGDTDSDGILDNVDGCPKQPEDLDGFRDQDGCPDPDNDKDGVPDEKDRCPNEPETINGFQDDDGCPDKGKVMVVVKQEKIEIRQKIQFATGKAKLKPWSYRLLNQVALTLQAHPEIRMIRIEGHTDSRGGVRRNKRLSLQRAEAVRRYLIRRGVDPDRLVAMGYGESMPVASNRTRRGRMANRRVEFTILERE